MKNPVRCGAKALILEDGRLLCLRKRGDIGDFYVLPGGGQLPGELLPEALVRECREELGARVEVGRLRYLQEYVGDNHAFRPVHSGLHFVNAYFDCRLLDPPGTLPLEPDAGQVGWEWLAVEALGGLPFYPRVLAARLATYASDGASEGPAYLGDSV